MESILRPNLLYRFVPFLLGTVSIAGALYFINESENFIYFILFIFFVLLSFGAIVEGFVAKIELGERELKIVGIFKQKKFEKEKIEKESYMGKRLWRVSYVRRKLG